MLMNTSTRREKKVKQRIADDITHGIIQKNGNKEEMINERKNKVELEENKSYSNVKRNGLDKEETNTTK